MKPAFKLAMLYALSGFLWIFGSDRLVEYIFANYQTNTILAIQTFKGFFYVGITAILLYLLADRYYKQLNDKLLLLSELNSKLQESEKRYSELFHLSPIPMWVYDIETLRFIEVNEAMERHYGYSANELKELTIKDIRPQEDITLLEETIAVNRKDNVKYFKGLFRHKKKNGELIWVELESNSLNIHGKPAKLILAKDVTDRFTYMNTIEHQNEKLKEISWIQSHVVRAPIAKLMGLTHLIKNPAEELTNKIEMMDMISNCADELDEIVREITHKAERIKLPNQSN